jgi:hypothetical protein
VTKASSGTIVGIVTNSAQLPVAGATVTAISASARIRATISGSDGVYSFSDVLPGLWSIDVRVDGFPEVAERAWSGPLGSGAGDGAGVQGSGARSESCGARGADGSRGAAGP